MRRFGRIAALSTIGLAGAAGAQVAPSPAASPLPTIAPPAAVPKARLPLTLSLSPVAAGGQVERTARVGRSLAMRVTIASTGNAAPRDRVHQRIASQMIDFYPMGGSGFHLSAGTRLFNPRSVGPSDVAARGLLPSQRRLNIPGLKTSMRRTPALTMGYTDRIDPDTSVGIEVGAMKGRAYNDAADVARQTRAERMRMGSPVNPMVNLVVGRRF